MRFSEAGLQQAAKPTMTTEGDKAIYYTISLIEGFKLSLAVCWGTEVVCFIYGLTLIS